MTKQHRDRDFLEAPRPEEGDVKAFLDSIDKVKISKKAKKKHEEAAANRKREEAQIESRLRKEDVGRGYEIRFNRYDTDSFYRSMRPPGGCALEHGRVPDDLHSNRS
jgi:hypothetical protein